MTTAYRPPTAAGSFYPHNPTQLAEMVDKLLVGPDIEQPHILIVPHAGYGYSGKVAGAAYATVRDYETVILLVVSHHHKFLDARVSSVMNWATPLGYAPLDRACIGHLTATQSIFHLNETVHQAEHGLEVQVPFLQRQLPDCVIVPILLSQVSFNTHQAILDGLLQVMNKHTLLVISSDLSHYPAPAEAERVDRATIEAILSNDPNTLERHLQLPQQNKIAGLKTCACGAAAIRIGMAVAQELNLGEGQLLRYANSGTVWGAVGYAAIAF